jgi:hypothetical protein
VYALRRYEEETPGVTTLWGKRWAGEVVAMTEGADSAAGTVAANGKATVTAGDCRENDDGAQAQACRAQAPAREAVLSH